MDTPEATIGEAAALFGLAPSTVRWWERQGVVPSPERAGGRRVYREVDLRRLGYAYLCCVTGRMTLGNAAVVASGQTKATAWHGILGDEVSRLDAQIQELTAARDYLAHLQMCPDDDPAMCPLLDAEISARTPRGRVGEKTLVAAARTAARTGPRMSEGRNETEPHRNEIPAGGRCAVCAGPIPLRARGRPRTYCSSACRQRAHRHRTHGKRTPRPAGD